MTNQHIANTIKEVKLLLGESIEDALYQDLQVGTRIYSIDESYEFKRDLLESANKVRVVLLDQVLEDQEFEAFIADVNIPIIALTTSADGFLPVIISKGKKGKTCVYLVHESDTEEVALEDVKDSLIKNEKGELVMMGAFSYKSLVSEHDEDEKPKTFLQ